VNTADTERRALELCEAALTLGSEARTDFLVAQCGDDAALLDCVQTLMRAVDDSEGFLEPEPPQGFDAFGAGATQGYEPSIDITGTNPARAGAPRMGTRIGRYTIVEPLGDGGMGTVYLAEHRDGDYLQRVAIKVLRAALNTREGLERFEAEKRVLARLNHPYIAGLIDSGTTDDGLPYLVMEYVQGLPIDRFCDDQGLDLRARIRLLVKVMLAVQAAHQNLVIHRDLKPSNVLITPDGLPKLLDFGIAKLLVAADEAGAAGELTQVWGQALTPNYASPEQILEGRATTVSDVYSLGVLAYQLLCGELPYRIDGHAQRALVSRFETLTVPRPSTRLARMNDAALADALARRRGLNVRRHAAALRGDLDNILLMALRLEPERRYGSVAQFAEDLQRFLDGHPVAARHDTLAYRCGKFLRRHWLPAAATGVLLLSLVGGVIGFAWQAEQARAERDRTLLVNDFLQSILIEADPYEAGADATIRDVLARADGMIAERFVDMPDLEASLRRTVGYTQLGLLELDAAAANLGRAHELNVRLYGEADQRSLQTRTDLAWTAFRRGDLEAAKSGYSQAIAMMNDNLPTQFRMKLLNDFAVVLIDTGDLDEAVSLLEDVRTLQASVETDPAEDATMLNNLAITLHDLGELDEAEIYYRESIAIGQSQPNAQMDPNLAIHMNNLAVLLLQLERPDEALTWLRESLDIRLTALGPDHGFTGLAHLQVGRVLFDAGDIEEARPHVDSALAISTAVLPEGNAQLLLARALAARLQSADGDAHGGAAALAVIANDMDELGMVDLKRLVDRWLADAESQLAAANAGEAARAGAAATVADIDP
jgi:eukaryotic-like serine/threonine-protein kinase